MLQTLHPVLSEANRHLRDENISFQEEGHKYTIHTDPNSKYTSVTTWNHSHFPHFNSDQVIKNMMRGKNWNPENKYWGMTAEQIKKQWSDNGASVSGAGTDMHYQIECFMNNPLKPYPYTQGQLTEYYYENELKDGSDPPHPISLEWTYFLEFTKQYPDLKPYRTEWTIYHEDLKLSGSIDMVYENPDGTLTIYDWKRSKEISRINKYNKFAVTDCISHFPDSNFWHYSLQLNTYKAILQEKYDKTVTDLYLVRLHPDAEEKTFELIKVPDLSSNIQELFDLRRKEQAGQSV
jgi:ATP-dependent exoDNAse (exonuclease V) beta subunit